MSTADSTLVKFNRTAWLICIIAAMGFLFDTYELLMLPLIIRPAMSELLHVKPNTPEFKEAFDFWYQMLFYLPALCGGIFGLLGGYLTDRLGRRRVLTWSILLYAVSACAAGMSTSMPMLVFFRVTTFIGVCVEFVAAVAWLAEMFSHPHQREKVLGYTQAFSSFGGLMVAFVFALCLKHASALPSIPFIGGVAGLDTHAAWRYTLISGLIPALPLILIRPFLPESPAWQLKKSQGTLRRPSVTELFAPQYRRATLITGLMFACSLGVAFGSIQHIATIVPGLAKAPAKIGDDPKMPTASKEEAKPAAEKTPATSTADTARAVQLASDNPDAKKNVDAEKKPVAKPAGPPPPDPNQVLTAQVQKFQELGGLLGRCAMAFLATVIISRQRLIRLFQIPGLIITPLVFYFAPGMSPELFQWGMLLVGFMAVAQLSFWGNYLPRVYPLHLRGTGESFAANIGGRMIGTSAALITVNLAPHMPKIVGLPDKSVGFAYAAAIVGGSVYLIGLIASFWLPEPPEELSAE